MEINSLCTKHTLPRRSQPLPEANLGVASSGCTCITGHWGHPFSALRCCRGVLWLVFGKATCTDRLWMEQRNRSGYLILRRRSLHFFFSTLPLTGRAGAGRKQRVQAQNRLLQKGGQSSLFLQANRNGSEVK